MGGLKSREVVNKKTSMLKEKQLKFQVDTVHSYARHPTILSTMTIIEVTKLSNYMCI